MGGNHGKTWGKHGENMGKHGEHMGTHGENMGKTWGKHGKIWENHGKIWANPLLTTINGGFPESWEDRVGFFTVRWKRRFYQQIVVVKPWNNRNVETIMWKPFKCSHVPGNYRQYVPGNYSLLQCITVYYTCWWFEPLWKIWKSVRIILPK